MIAFIICCTNDDESKYPVYLSVCLLVSLPFLLLTFIVYTVLPELQNVHGYTLRAHVVSLFITYVFMFCGTKISKLEEIADINICCIIIAYVYHFFFLSSFFWLNVICFDIWWTFRKIRLCRLNMKQVKKKFVIYSIYAWGVPLIFTIFCAIMDNVCGILENWKPEICVDKFWFGSKKAKTLYFYVPILATVISNSFFFIATTVSIIHQIIRSTNHLKTSDNKSYNKNKHRIKLFVKLFVMMIYGGIIWIIEVIAWKNTEDYSFVLYPTDMLNSLQGVIIFVIFVYNNKTKQLLLKRFGGQSCGPFCMVPAYKDTTTSNITSTLTMESSREIDSFNQQSSV
ncbi:G-protein coupled receptor Mth2 [Solenopsis invicta]|uniref:G-protein coupled receptor Mth2 n=1 Tax=Solenopsis invicta TaxID=13686 RepID=UPI000595F5AF|nr:G-protein coupled receptor Mth2 [Solenopsis invicta]XP_011175317.1 G-protein coupled receptor Mth2 [Solenopsis invicta]XP_039303292.1 G-protein coupled receptor Mth2 [Solenopsis invicta]